MLINCASVYSRPRMGWDLGDDIQSSTTFGARRYPYN